MLVPALLALALLGLPACGPGSPAGGGATTPVAAQDPAVKPEFTIPEGAPPDELVVETLIAGDGATAETGDTVRVHYVGKAWSTGAQFDASWDRGQPFDFELGAGRVIPGWDRGIRGMQVGGRRRLVIPPGLAYGEQGAGEAIGPGETLVFVVDLLEVS